MREIFKNLIAKNKLAHGYVFFGSDEKILAEFVNWLASFLENYRPPQGDNRLAEAIMFDALVINPVIDSISIDKVREIKNFLWQRPIRSTKRTVIIHSADKLTPEAQNAILKIAEEPPASALIILLVRDLENLLDTLVSRFQKIYISNSPEVQLRESLSAKKYTQDFLNGTVSQRKKVIKDILEQEGVLDSFIKILMLELNRQPLKNWQALKELCHRWRLINQYNVNKRLQLEVLVRIFNDQFSINE